MSIWEWFATHPADAQVFDDAMRRGTTITADTIAAAYPWPRQVWSATSAGGVGTLLSAIIGREEPVCAACSSTAPTSSPGPIRSSRRAAWPTGSTRSPGDIFSGITATADVYLLKDVLHDWDNERCRKILSTVAAAMPSGSRLVLVEILQHPNTPNPMAPWADLLMLTQTDGGRQRSADELARLLIDAGLHPTGTVRHAIPHDLVEAVKP